MNTPQDIINFRRRASNLIKWSLDGNFEPNQGYEQIRMRENSAYFSQTHRTSKNGEDFVIEQLVKQFNSVQDLLDEWVCDDDIDSDDIETILHEGKNFMHTNVGNNNADMFYIAGDDGLFYVVKGEKMPLHEWLIDRMNDSGILIRDGHGNEIGYSSENGSEGSLVRLNDSNYELLVSFDEVTHASFDHGSGMYCFHTNDDEFHISLAETKTIAL